MAAVPARGLDGAAATRSTPSPSRDSTPAALGPLADALSDRYRVERELGRGGMATVYLARDLRHDRPVALKVLHPELAATLGPERFLREIKLAARLQHPHILGVLDSGEAAAGTREAGGRGAGAWLWFAMPYVEGETLRDRLRRERQLPVGEAVRITTEAARALDYAHRQGIIHRDIKPENLLLTRDGDTLVADLGIGRALGAPAPGEMITEIGIVVGTPAYMAPEQAAGERELDGRTDTYALAVVLYEMLAGEAPFTGPTAQAILARRFTSAPRPLRELRESVPEAVEQAVTGALAKSPADRFQTAGDFARALVTSGASAAAPRPSPAGPAPAPRVTPGVAARAGPAGPRRTSLAVVALGLGFLLGLGVLFGWSRTHSGQWATAGPKRLAVLPFENLGRPEDEYFADGVTDAVRGKLAALPGLQVTPRGSSGRFKHTAKSPGEIGRELGVQYLLTATVRWQQGQDGTSRVEVSPELIEVASASTKWQQPFGAALTDAFRVQAEIAGRVAGALDTVLSAGRREKLAEQPARLPAAPRRAPA